MELLEGNWTWKVEVIDDGFDGGRRRRRRRKNGGRHWDQKRERERDESVVKPSSVLNKPSTTAKTLIHFPSKRSLYTH